MLNDRRDLGDKICDPVVLHVYDEEVEPLFSVAAIRALRLAPRYCNSSVSDFLAHQVGRDPTDLLRHVQRVSYFLTKHDGHGAYGAIVDLFVALGAKGIALRRNMLRTATPVLSLEQHHALEEKLESGLSPLDRMPLSSESILGKGIRGATCLVERNVARVEAGRDVLEEARSHLEYGQVDEARQVLELALLQDPLREDVPQELLEIYMRYKDKKDKDHKHFSAMLQALRFMGNPIPSAWQHLAAELGLDEPAHPLG